MSLDPNKTYLVWNDTEFPNSTDAQFNAPAGSTIDWGDGTVETFDTASTTVNTHTYTDGKTEHTIAISGLTSIGTRAFAYCSSLTSVTIPNSVTSIGTWAFNNCSSLTSITIPNSVTSIDGATFSGCSSLTSVTIPNSVTSIGTRAFAYCSSLTSITIPNSVTSISSFAFAYCSSLTSITIPNSVTSISSSAFAYCSSLTSITIPNSVTSIDGATFSGCSSLTSITIPNSVTSIGTRAFAYCSSLTSITIPNSVTSIDSATFSGCSRLTQLILFPSTPPTLGSDVIPDNVQLIYVPQSSKAAYQAATSWAEFATEPNNKIVSDNLYLSFVRFNQKNKEYIKEKISESTPPSVNVVQNTGNSTTDVMSQKAVTDAINAAVTTTLNTEV